MELLVIEGLLVAGEPLLEGCFSFFKVSSESVVLLGSACSFNSALVNKTVGLTLPFQGAVSFVLGPAVAALNLQASRGSKYLLQELLGYVDADLVVSWRGEPGHISLPDPLLSCRLLDVLELVVVPCFL